MNHVDVARAENAYREWTRERDRPRGDIPVSLNGTSNALTQLASLYRMFDEIGVAMEVREDRRR